MVEVFAISTCGAIVVFAMIMIWQRARKGAIYWNKEVGQIMTKGGKCLYDKGVIDRQKPDEQWREECNEVIRSTNQKASEFVAEVATSLRAQLQCGAKGHGDWVYQKPQEYLYYTCLGSPTKRAGTFIFKCSTCNLEKTLTWKELTVKQRDGLKVLGVK